MHGTYRFSRSLSRRLSLAASVLFAPLVFSGCGGGGGGGGVENNFSGNALDDPTLSVVGPTGKLSATPTLANELNGSGTRTLATSVSGVNQWFRIEFPFRVKASSILSPEANFAPFSFLNGNLTVTDQDGNHLPGVALINGIDAQGVDRSGDPGYPASLNGSQDRNLGFTNKEGVAHDAFVYVADEDGDLSTFAAFNPVGGESMNSSIEMVHITISSVNGVSIDACYTVPVGADATAPSVVSIVAEDQFPDPDNPGLFKTNVNSSFLVEFSEAMVPQAVGRSAELNGNPFSGNMPIPPLLRPFPNVIITATVPLGAGLPLFVPYDVVPINTNNLTKYRLTPLIMLPSNGSAQILVHTTTTNLSSTYDMAGNTYNGETGAVGIDFTQDFPLGPGPAVVNIPVSPEVVYWLPNSGRGVGAIDLNGFGITTNAPGANAGDILKAPLITRVPSYNPISGIGHLGRPGNGSHNNYSYPVGTGSTPYGFGITPGWEAPADPGNLGTPFPGVNEGSSGFETLCRDSVGDVVLTGRENSEVGRIEDAVVGEFLDLVFNDDDNFWTNDQFHTAGFTIVPKLGRNSISDPPYPNPPPTRYWVGLPHLSVTLDQADPTNTAFLIEGEEVFSGRLNGMIGLLLLRPNPDNVFAPDTTVVPSTLGLGVPPFFGMGPGPQSATMAVPYAARQQIGNFLYVTDVENKLVHALNSNTMRPISSINLPDPVGIGIAPDNGLLFVSNFANNSVSIVDTDPMSPTFHQEVNRILVGDGPRGVSVQPDYEDIFVSNFIGDDISIIDVQSLSVRKTVDALVNGPFDIVLTARQQTPISPNPSGFAAGIFFGYISNFEGNSVLVYESGPDGPQGIGFNNILGEIPTGSDPEIVAPRGIYYSPYQNPQGLEAGGVFVAHRDVDGFGRVSHIQFTNQFQFGPIPRQVPPGFFIPPGFTDRQFEVVGQWGSNNNNRLHGFIPTDVVLADMNTQTYNSTPAGLPNFAGFSPPPHQEATGAINSHHYQRIAPGAAFNAFLPDRLYVAYQDVNVIDVINPQSAGAVVNTISGADVGVKKLVTYWSQ